MPARRVLFYLILAGLLARVIYLDQVASLPFFQDPVGDSARYLERAREILDGRLVGDRPFFYGGIFYPYLLALSFLLLGANLYPICLAQAAAGCALAWILFEIGRAAAPTGAGRDGERIGLLAAGMALLYGPFAFMEADVLMISWTLLLEAAAALLLLRSLRAGDGVGPARALIPVGAAGVCLGLAASERPNLIALLPLAAAWVAICGRSPGRIRGASALLAGGGAVLVLVLSINHAASGRWVPLTTSTGINFYIGNHAAARGTFDEPWSAAETHFTARHTDLEEASLTMARRLAGEDLDAVEASRFWLDRGLRFVRESPGEAAALWLRKLSLFWSAAELPNHLNFTFMRSAAPALWLMPLGFGLVAPLGLYGLASRGARGLILPSASALLSLLAAVPMVTVLPFFVADRYRLPAVPPLLLLAACGLLDLSRLLARRLTRRSGSLRLACVVLLGLLMATPIAGFDASREYWMLAQAHKRRGDLAEAARCYDLALREAPGDAVLHNNLGVVLGQMGDPARAEAEYRRALEADPALAFPRKNLGLLLMRSGRAEEAFEHLAAAERGEPDDIEVARALAALYMARGESGPARRRALRVLAAVPGDPTAREVLQAAGEAGSP